MFRALRVPSGNERGPIFMEQVLTALQLAMKERDAVCLRVLPHRGEVTLSVDAPDTICRIFSDQVYAQFPDAKLESLPEIPAAPGGRQTWIETVALHGDLFPIKRAVQFEDSLARQFADPLTATMAALNPGDGFNAELVLTVRPAHRRIVRRRQRCIRRLAHPFFRHHHRVAHLYVTLALSPRRLDRVLGWLLQSAFPHDRERALNLDHSGSRTHEREEDLAAAHEKAGRPQFAVTMTINVTGPTEKASIARTKIAQIFGTFAVFAAPGRNSFERGTGKARPFILAADELAALWHPPTSLVKAPAMAVVESREAEPPVRLPTPNDHPGLAVLGQAQFRNRRQLCGLLPDDRRRHLLIEGKTGMGKSTLLERLIRGDIAAGHGVALIDPHGDLCDSIVSGVPSFRSNDVVLFDVADSGHPLAFNVLTCSHPSRRALVASGIVAAFKKIWGEFFGPRMEHILRNALLTLTEVPGATLLSVVRILGDARYRESVVRHVSDPVVRSFWEREFASWPPKFQAEAVAPVYNKVGQLISNPLLRNILGQSESTVDLRSIMDEGKALLVNLSKGRVGEDASALLGAFLVTSLQQAAMSRADRAEADRRDFHLFIDEFQNFATDAFATILSEARKYRLSLTVANQYLDQIDEATRSAVFGNVGSMISFQVGVDDAEILAEQFGGDLTPKDLLTLPRFQAYAKLLIAGHPSRPFSLRTLAPSSRQPKHERRAQSIRRYCRQRYGRALDQVEREIARAMKE